MMFDPTEFIARSASAKIEYGTDDCGLWIADWWNECHGVDPAAHLRGNYSGDSQKRAIVAGAGGLANLVSGIADKSGAREILLMADIQVGDFAVIAPGVCAIRADGYWAARADEGVIFVVADTRVWRAWSITE